MTAQPLPEPFMGVVALRQNEDHSFDFQVTCLGCGKVHTFSMWGDVASYLDTIYWEPAGGWDKDTEPLGEGWLCPTCYHNRKGVTPVH